MSVQPPQDIKVFLQQQEVQKSIQKSMHDAHANATVTISTAAELFGFSESQLREWEKKGLVTTKRETLTQDGRGPRQYSPQELDKLAIIKVLIDEGNYSPRLIPPNVDKLWQQVVVQTQQNHTPEHRREYTELVRPSPDKHLPIDKRVEHAEKEVFWRYFPSQALRLSLMLICEDIPDTIAGLILPLQRSYSAAGTPTPRTLPERGEVLVGWLDANRSFHTFLDSAATFEEPGDFRIQSLVASEEDLLEEQEQDQTLIVVQRKARSLHLTPSVVETIRRLLKPIYQNIEAWRPAFDYGMRDWLYQATDFTSNTNAFDDVLLNDMMDMVIHLGGRTADNQDRWRFACLLLPDDPSLPLQQRKLIVRSQSEQSPYKIGTNISSVSPGLSLRAYQSGNVIYQPNMSEQDSIIAYREKEQNTHSAIAIPIAGEDGLSIATLYIASSEINAFPEEDQRVLRIICQMVEELLLVYSARQLAPGKLTELISTPDIVDTSFKKFLSENDFIRDLEALLIEVQSKNVDEYTSSSDEYKPTKEEVSFIAIDIDKHSTIAAKYGDRIARNLSREVGSRLFDHLTTIFANSLHRRLYHINADKYYLILDGMPVDEARQRAEQIRVALKGEYPIDAQRVSAGRPTLEEAMLELPDITVRLGIAAYTYRKFKEIFGRYSPNTAVSEVRTLITKALDEVLKKGQREGGDVIISWDHKLWWYTKWTPPPT